MLKNIRAFFDERGVIEVETPLLSQYSTTDPHLDSLQSRFRDQSCYLNTSPEYSMKRLLAGWKKPIYQICKAFRDDELGPNHNPEFTMLEWYRPGYDAGELMAELAELVISLCLLSNNSAVVPHGCDVMSMDGRSCLHYGAKSQEGGAVMSRKDGISQGAMDGGAINEPKDGAVVHGCAVNEPKGGVDNVQFESLSYQQAFTDFVGINPHQTTSAECYLAAKSNNIEIPQGLGLTDELNNWLDWLLIQQVLPAFKKDRFTFLYDYPASQCALAKVAKNEQQVFVAKRFELFFGEIELANGFHELTDANEQLQRFKLENKVRKKSGLDSGYIDENFIAALRSGLPECSGVAVGLDRLLMVLAKAAHIEQVISFPWGKA